MARNEKFKFSIGEKVKVRISGKVGTVVEYIKPHFTENPNTYGNAVLIDVDGHLRQANVYSLDSCEEEAKLQSKDRTIRVCGECREDLAIGDKLWQHKADPNFCQCCDATPTRNVEIKVVAGKVDNVDFDVITNISMEQDCSV